MWPLLSLFSPLVDYDSMHDDVLDETRFISVTLSNFRLSRPSFLPAILAYKASKMITCKMLYNVYHPVNIEYHPIESLLKVSPELMELTCKYDLSLVLDYKVSIQYSGMDDMTEGRGIDDCQIFIDR